MMAGMPGKKYRILDPIHGLIAFENEPLSQLAIDLINSREFQRLRRIRQLGLSEYVFPGATHTRFSHCVGVFHTARNLLSVIERSEKYDKDKANIAAIAALLHDLGHGPFSHTFEGVEKARGKTKKHEVWTAELIRGDTEIHSILENFSKDTAEQVAQVLLRDDPSDIYDAVVSSQFDADRLDYLRRDRYMTGSGSGGFDFDWLVDCLDVGEIAIGMEGEDDIVNVPGFFLNFKGKQAAEDYLLARYHLYSQVYMHKTTRGAEKMLGALLSRVASKVQEGDFKACGLSKKHLLAKYFSSTEPSVSDYINLDDTIVWSAISEMRSADDAGVRSLAAALLDRKLYKCFDVGVLLKDKGIDARQRFKKAVSERLPKMKFEFDMDVLVDDTSINAYGEYEIEDRGAHQKVLVAKQENSSIKEDIAQASAIIGSIGKEKILRYYVPNEEAVNEMSAIWKEVAG